MEAIKVAFVIDYLDVGGTEQQLLTLLQGMNFEQFKPYVITLKSGGRVADQIQELDIPVLSIFPPSRFFPKVVNRSLQTLALALFLRIQHIQVIQNYLFTANIFGTIAAKMARVPVICASERGVTNTDGEDLESKRQIFRKLAPWIDVVFGNSKMVVEYLVNTVQIPHEKVRCIHNGIAWRKYQQASPYNLREELQIDESVKIIAIIARLIPRKNHLLLFRAAQLIREDYPNFRVVIIGDGTHRKTLQLQAEEMGLDPIIYFMGDRSNIAEILKSVDIVVQSSNSEGLPNVIMEAMSASKPVVATDAGGTGELVIHRETGFLIPCGDYKVMAARITSLLLNPTRMRHMGRCGKKHIQTYFSREHLVTTTQQLYLELLKGKSELEISDL